MGSAVREVHDAAGQALPAGLLDAAEPVILRDYVADWPLVGAARQGTDTAFDYLEQHARDTMVLAFRTGADAEGRVFYNADMSGFNFERISCALPELLRRLRAGEPLYLGSTSVEECFPGFGAEHHIDLGSARPLVSVWMGGKSRVAAHFDAPENIACVVAGRRRFTLFAPDQLENLYVGPLDFTPAGQAISLVDSANPDFERYPKYREALDAALVADLEPGDALYLPSMWWHQVEGTDALNVLVNYWWISGRPAIGSPLNALIHGILALRGLPAAQRHAWRGLFEHYVFSDDADLSHIPEERRGVLGEIDAEMARQLRAMLRSKLG